MNDEPEANQSKSRKKKDKRLSQQNKCLNEKRRREQESIYMEELAELISASIADMSSFPAVKPDKCAILQETVNQIRRIKQEESGSSDAVQQSQVSSSKPGILASDVIGPLLLEALDGFLFVVSSQGKVVFVSDNVTQYLKYSQDDIVGKSIYNIIHVGDHAQFSSSLLPMSVGPCLPWQTDSPGGKSRTFNCRMLIKPAGEENDELEVKQQQVSQYESMQILAILQPYPSDQESESSLSDSDNQTCLVCIARRIGFQEKNSGMLGIEQFTTKQDLKGKILNCDTSGVHPGNYRYPDFIGQNIQEFCHVNDVSQLAKHHQEVVKNGSNTSGVYRFKLQENRYVFVQTKSKLFNHPNTNQPEFIMSTHSIVRECDTDTELKGSASTSLMKSIIGQSGTKKGDLSRIIGMGKKPSNPLGLMESGNLQVGNFPSLNTLNRILSTNPGGAELDFPGSDSLGEILDLLPSSSSWNPAEAASTSTGISAANVTMSMVSSTPVTQVSWSGRTAVSIAQSPGTRAPSTPGQMPASMQQVRSMMGVGMGNKGPISPISPGYMPQRSPGYAAQRSPGYAPSPGAMTPRSKSPASGQMLQHMQQQPRTPGPGMMSPQSRRTSYSSVGGQLTEDDLNMVFDDTRELLEALTQSPMNSAAGPHVGQHGNPSQRQRSFSAHENARSHQGAPSTPTWDGSGGMQNPLKALNALQVSAGGGGGADPNLNGRLVDTLRSSFMHNQNPFMKELYVTMEKKLDQRTKLRQLLTASTSNEASPASAPSLPASTNPEDLLFSHPANPPPIANKGKEASKQQQQQQQHQHQKDMSQPQQSPQPVPSPRSSLIPTPSPQQPQSTSADDPDSSSRDGHKTHRDPILKQLLSQNDEVDEEEEASSPSGNQASTNKSSGPTPSQADTESDKADNEAEAKRMDNKLLKQLLNDDQKQAGDEDTKTHLLQKLLQQDEDSDDADHDEVNAESTSKDEKGRGGSGKPSSSSSNSQSADSSILSKLFNGASSSNSSSAANQNGGASNTLSQMMGQKTPNKPKDELTSVFESLWEKGSDPDSNSNGSVASGFNNPHGGRHGVKRKHSAVDGVDSSTDSTDMDSSTGAGMNFKPSQKNILLTKLLSKKPSTETVAVNTQTINAIATPQARLPKNIANKILDIPNSVHSNNSDMMDTTRHEAQSSSGGEVGQKPTPWDNPRTNPDTPFPGNTKDKHQMPNSMGGQLQSPMGNMGAPNQHQSMFTQGSSSMNNAPSGLSALTAMAGGHMGGNPGQGGANNMSNHGGLNDPALAQILQETAGLNSSPGGSLNFNQPMTDDTTLLSQLEHVLQTSEISFSELDNMLGISGNQQSAGFTGEDEQMAIEAIQQSLMNIESAPTSSASMPGQPPISIQGSMAGTSSSVASLNSVVAGIQNNGGSNNMSAEAQRQLQLRRLQQLHGGQLPQGLGPNQLPQNQSGFQQPNMLGFGQGQQQQQQPPQTLQGAQRFSQPQNVQGMSSPPAMPNAANQQQINNNVRQTLLMKQRQKHVHAQQQQVQQRLQQEQDRQRLLLQQTQQRQPQPFGQFPPQGPQNTMVQPMERMQSPGGGGIPENFNELMNTSMAPNVSLQRNQGVPGPMSPRFQQGQLGPQQGGQVGGQQQQQQQPPPAPPQQQQQQQQQQSLSQMLRGNTPQPPQNRGMSPFGNQGPSPQNPNQPQLYTQRPNPAMMAGGAMTQLGGNNMNPRMGLMNQNIGGINRQNSQENQFQFPGEQQFSGGQGGQGGQANQMGMMSPQANQQQALLAQQNRMMQARMGSMGMTSPQMSPRGGQQTSPFGPGQGVQEQHLMSPQPQKHSPGSVGNQQLTPPFSVQSSQYSQAGFSSPVMSAAGQQNFNPLASASPLTPDPLFSPTVPMQQDRKQSVAQPPVSTTQYVKQELRALCNNRTQNQAPSIPAAANNTDLLAGLDLVTESGEIPMDLFETINELTKATEMNNHQKQQLAMGGNQGPQPMQTGEVIQEDSIVNQQRMEAHRRFQKFQQLSHGEAQQTMADAGIRATNLFRNQLISPQDISGNGKPQQAQGPQGNMGQSGKPSSASNVQVVTSEPRPQCDDIKPAEHKNSLLSKLLSDS